MEYGNYLDWNLSNAIRLLLSFFSTSMWAHWFSRGKWESGCFPTGPQVITWKSLGKMLDEILNIPPTLSNASSFLHESIGD